MTGKVPPHLSTSSRITRLYQSVGANAPKPPAGLPTKALTEGGAFSADRGPVTVAQVAQAAEAVEAAAQPGGAPKLRQETVEQLKAVQEATQTHIAQKQAENTPPNPEEPSDVLKELETSEASPAVADRMATDEVRKAVEARCKAIDLMDGIAEGVFKQVVPIIPGKLEVEFQSIDGSDAQSVRLLLLKWIDSDKNVDFLYQDVLSLMSLTISLVRINSRTLPPHRTKAPPGHAEFDENAFMLKYKAVRALPSPILHMLGVNAKWFDERVREAVTMEALKKY